MILIYVQCAIKCHNYTGYLKTACTFQFSCVGDRHKVYNNTVCCRFDQYFHKVKLQHYTFNYLYPLFSQKLIKHIKRHIFKFWGAGSSHLDMNCVCNALRMLVLIAFVLKNLQGKIFMTNCLNMWNFGKKNKTIFKLI